MLAYVFLSLFLAGVVLWISSWKYKHLPGLGFPIIGVFTRNHYSTTYHGVIKKLKRTHDQHGGAVAAWVGPAVVISIADPVLFEQLAYLPVMSHKEPYMYGVLRGVMNGAASELEPNESWRHLRKAVTSGLTKKNLYSYHEVHTKMSRELVEVFKKKTGEFNVLPYIMLMTLDIVFENFIGFSANALGNELLKFHENVMALAEDIVNRVLFQGILKVDTKYLMSFKEAYRVNQLTVKRFKENMGRKNAEQDFVPIAYNLVQEKSTKVTDDKLMKLIAELLIESQYTVGLCLSGALLHLAANPEFLEKALEEQRMIFSDSLEPPELNHLKDMHYLERVIKEAVRLTSAPITGRRNNQDIKAGGIFIPKNSTVLFLWDQVRSDTKYWKRGGRFDPDHFLPEEVAKRPKCAYFAFSAGVRACPGGQFAINTMKVVLSTIIRNFKISSPLKPEELSYHSSIFSHLDGPHTISLEPRIKTSN